MLFNPISAWHWLSEISNVYFPFLLSHVINKMGNSESNPPKAQQGNIPQQAPVLAPYNGYNYYQNQYWPQLYDYSNYPGYGYAMYPAYYPAYYNDQPAGSNEKDISKRVHSQTRKKDVRRIFSYYFLCSK
jgi:hypothetical protein